ncbi:MAG: DUF362 domain-containing protein [bacterium]
MNTKVSIIKCEEYNRQEVFDAVHDALELIGGIEKFVKKGQKVLLKPNMLSAKNPKKAITTHPLILEAMIKEVRSAGGEVWIGDSPSGAIKGVKRCWVNTGFLDVAEKMKVRLINFETGGTEIRDIEGEKFHFTESFFKADVVINLPKFKTHGFTLYTGCIKNMFGTLPGLQKAFVHKRYPHPESFSKKLVDIYECVIPSLHLMDGIWGMEGEGPATGKKRKTGLILAGSDGVALDTVASLIMGFAENEVDMIRIAGQRGLGVNNLGKIKVVGNKIDDVKFDDFKLPSNRLIKLVPEFLMKLVGRLIWVKPEANKNICTSCGQCERSCPVGAIQMVDKYPVIDYKVCINCLCCNESCPEGAIEQKLSWLARKIS